MIAALAVVVAWYFLVFTPTNQQMTAAHIEASTVSTELETLLIKLKNVPDQLKTEQGLDSLREAINSSLYATNEIERLFNEFTDEAETYGLTVTEITPSVEELLQLEENLRKKDFAPSLNFGVRMTGRFVDFGQFVERLEAAPFFQGINKVTVNAQAEPGKPLTFYLDMRALLQEHGTKS
jgi:Tfp pilus assembly protein PilO